MTMSPYVPVRALTDYLTLGRSGLRVSPLCLGSMTFGEQASWASDVKGSEAVLAHFLALGGNFIDTANVYANGYAEQIIGEYLARSGQRERAVIATKFCGNLYYRDPNGGGAGRKSMMHAVHESLRRLKTDYIDLYWVHFWDRNTPIEETLRALDDLVRAGKIRYIGLSNTPAWKVAQAQTMAQLRGWSPLVAVQVEYSLIERSHEADLLPMAEELGLAITAWSPVKSGLLTGKYTRATAANTQPERADFLQGAFNERNFGIVDVVVDIAKELNTTAARVSLAWLLARPGTVIPIVGARNSDQLDQNLNAAGVTLSAAQLQRLDAVSAPAPDFMSHVGMIAPLIMHGGIGTNGVLPPEFPLGPKPDIGPR